MNMAKKTAGALAAEPPGETTSGTGTSTTEISTGEKSATGRSTTGKSTTGKSTTGRSTGGKSAAGAPQAAPVLYAKPVPLTPQRHAKLRLAAERDYAVAAGVNSVPVNAIELRHAAKHYPVVFSARAPAMSICILGLSEGENLFVGEDGRWAADHYVPAYIRRYPFIFMAGPDRQQYVLCVDEAAECVGNKGDAFFRKGEPTEVTQRALSFCSSYQTQSEATREYVAALEAQDLLVPNRAEITVAGGETLRLGGFRIIDEKRFAGLADEVFLDWRRRGWLPHVYAHFMSMANWSALIARRNARR